MGGATTAAAELVRAKAGEAAEAVEETLRVKVMEGTAAGGGVEERELEETLDCNFSISMLVRSPLAECDSSEAEDGECGRGSREDEERERGKAGRAAWAMTCAAAAAAGEATAVGEEVEEVRRREWEMEVEEEERAEAGAAFEDDVEDEEEDRALEPTGTLPRAGAAAEAMEERVRPAEALRGSEARVEAEEEEETDAR